MLLLLLACHPDDPKDAADDTGGDTATDTGADTGDTAPPSDNWCDRVLPGAPGGDAMLDLSAAHATHRLFGVDGKWSELDAALVLALTPADAVTAPDLAAYVAGFEGICAVAAVAPARPASPRRAAPPPAGGTVVFAPGDDLSALPTTAAAWAIDVRGVAPSDHLLADLEAATALVLEAGVMRPDREERGWYGMVDQVYSSSNLYFTEGITLEGTEWPAGASSRVPVAILTDDRTAPLAAELAISLRLAGRAWIVGEDQLSAVAEADWAPVADQGLLMRTRILVTDEGDFPDVVPADLRTADPVAAVADLATWGDPPALTPGEATRADVGRLRPWGDDQGSTLGLGEARAAVVVAHGSLRRFWPYFSVGGDALDDRLGEVLADIGTTAPERTAQTDHLGRLGNALGDGHMFTGDLYAEAPPGCLAADFDLLDGEAVVEHSALDEIVTGDVLVAIDGEPAADWFAATEAVVGGATPWYAFNIASRRLWYMWDDTTYTLRGLDGVEREVTLPPGDCDAMYALPWGHTNRASGWLDDLGAPDVYYLNYDAAVTTGDAQWQAALEEAAGGAGLVVDMRGYPGTDHYALAEALIDGAFQSMWFNVPIWNGPDLPDVDASFYEFTGTGTLSVVLMVGPRSVSAAENFGAMLVDSGQVTVVGRTSAGTNGNITGMALPGGHYMLFTGMEVTHADGSQFHGIGLIPDVEVVPTREEWAAGRDPELEAAAAVFGG